MSDPETIRDAAVAAYRAGERRLRRYAMVQRRAGNGEESNLALALARQVGIEMVRNIRGRKRDEWERPGTDAATSIQQADHENREGQA